MEGRNRVNEMISTCTETVKFLDFNQLQSKDIEFTLDNPEDAESFKHNEGKSIKLLVRSRLPLKTPMRLLRMG